jgi:hypothetical protein
MQPLYEESMCVRGIVDDWRDEREGARINVWGMVRVRLDEFRLNSQTRYVLCLEAYSHYYDGAEPDVTDEVLLPLYTGRSAALRQAITDYDAALAQFSGEWDMDLPIATRS